MPELNLTIPDCSCYNQKMVQRLPAINIRQRNIIRALLGANRKITLGEMAEETGLSARAVRYNMGVVRSWLEEHKLEFINRPGYGLEVVASQERKNELLKGICALDDCDIVLTRQQRIRIVLLYLLTSNEPVVARQVSEIEQFSRSTFFKDISEIEAWLNGYQIRLNRRSSKGLWIECAEESRRFALARLLRLELGEKTWFQLSSHFSSRKGFSGDAISRRFSQIINQLDLRAARQLILYIEDHIGINLSPFSQTEIMVYLAITIQALRDGRTLDGTAEEEVRAGEDFAIAQVIAYQIQKQFHCDMSEKEKEVIATLITSSKLDSSFFPNPNNAESDLTASQRNLRIAREIINICSMRLHPMIKIDDVLLHELASHLDYAVFRLRYHSPIRNSYLDTIREKYTQIFRVAASSAFILEKEINGSVPPEEIGFISMYLLAALERLRTVEDSRLTATIANDGVRSKGSLLKARLEFEFPNLRVEKVVNTYQIQADGHEGTDIIISTLPLENCPLPVIQVSPFLELEDIKNIQRWMTDKSQVRQGKSLSDFSQQNSLVDLIKLPHITFMDQAPDWQSIVRQASLPLIHSNCIQPRYVDAMLELIEQYGFYMYMGSGVLLLHAKPTDGVNQLCISLLKLHAPYHFGDNRIPDVNLIFVLGATDDNSHLTALFQLNELIQFPDFMQSLRDARSPYDIVHTLWRWLPELPEDF